MSEGWFQQLAGANIGMSVLCPGFVKTRIHESGRARQEKYGGVGDVDPGVAATREEAAQNVLNGIDPDIVGNSVLEAVRNGEFYIFTHPAMRAFVEVRFQMILAAFDAAANSPALASVRDHNPVTLLTPKP
jgi:short-subunit dehydrogenase